MPNTLLEMGGHSKKAGRGGGGSKGRRQEREKPKTLKKDLGVPDLKGVAQKLANTARGRTHSVLSIPHMHGTECSGSSGGEGGRRLAGLVRGGGAFAKGSLGFASLMERRQQPQHSFGANSQAAENDPAQQLADRRREMLTLALRSSERVHDYEAPLQLLGDSNLQQGEVEVWEDDIDHRGKDTSLRRFFKEFHRVVESCDVLLQVLDARDPLGCRLTQMERSIRSMYGEERKKMVVVLNKADLLPSKEVLDAWVHYFEQQEHMMCIPFTATAKGALGQSYVSNMFRRLRSLARNEETGERKSIVVGVIGYPNVGKSSIINALKRKHVVGVGNMPGFTTGNTEVELRSDIRVMDCPGVVAPGEDSGDVVLRNAVKVSDLVNPLLPVQRLLQRCTAVDGDVDIDSEDVAAQRALRQFGLHPLALFYGIGQFRPDDTIDFLQQVGIRRGRLTRGGEVDEESTARMVLSDWNDGRIPYYTYPPAVDELFLRDAGAYHATARADEESDTFGRYSGTAELVSTAARGVSLDGLPTFHLNMRMMNGQGAKKRWMTAAAGNDNEEGDYYDNDDDSDVEL